MKKIFLLFISAICLSSCKKFLDAKPDATLTVPSTIEDLQLIMDDYITLNSRFPTSLEEGSDDYFLLTQDLNGLTDDQKNIYLWQKEDRVVSSWQTTYKAVFVTNSVLKELPDIAKKTSDASKIDNVKGSALFLRSYLFYTIAQVYANPYNKATAAQEKGIPLKVDPDITEASSRSTLQETYNFIINDLKQAAAILPVTPSIVTRPSKPAAFGALARTYLAMGEYALAGEFADSCLKYSNALLNYNDFAITSNAPFTRFKNPEVIFHARTNGSSLLGANSNVDTLLYRSYHSNDLRKTAFFRPQPSNPSYYIFKGDYDGVGTGNLVFTGIVTDEMYLIRAESYARANNVTKAMQDLNTLLETRWKKNTFTAFTANSAAEALTLILTERRKELLRRGSRWTDLRRLKDDPQYGITPQRIYENKSYTLPANSPRYTFQLPLIVIQRSTMEQNP